MTKRTTFATRFLAMALALVLCVSNVMPGLALRATAEGPAQTAAELVAASYQLSAEEAALLTSGYLKSEKYTLDPIGGQEDLVTVSGNTVTAKPYGEYAPIGAELVIGTTRTPIALVDGVGTINTDALVYSVVVTYEQTKTVAADVQKALLNVDEVIMRGLANLEAGYETETNLDVVRQAVPTLMQLVTDSTIVEMCKITDDTIAAVNALNAENAAAGKLELQVKNAEYYASSSKLQYLQNNAAAYSANVAKTYGYLAEIAGSKLLTNENVDATIEAQDELDGTNNATLWGAFKGCLNELVADLNAVANADWTTTDLLADGVDYAAAEALVKAITTSTPVEVKENLTVGYETVTVASDNAMNVSVVVRVNYIVGKNDTTYYDAADEIVVAKDATAEEIEAAVAESGLEAVLFERIKNSSAEMADICEHSKRDFTNYEAGVYKIYYSPASYTVSSNYADDYEVGYNQVITLPVHNNATMAYDYVVDGVAMYQGEEITVRGDVTIERTEGKAYLIDNVYGIVGDNANNEIVKAILDSGALVGDKTIRVRQPDVSDAEGLLTLVDGKLTGKNYTSTSGDVWVPYSYGTKGTENLFSNGTGSWSAVEAKVIYRYNVAGYDGAALINLAKTLKADAEAQAASMDRLLSYKSDLSTLTRGMLGGLIGTIDVTDLTPGDNNYDDARCVQLREAFTAAVRGIIKNNLDGDKLRVYGMVEKYENIGLKYYYDNAADVRNEISALADGLSELTGTPEKDTAMGEVLKAVGKADMLDKIAKLGTVMAEVKAGLTLPNEKIDLKSANLGKLMNALAMEGELETAAVTAPYLQSVAMTAKDVSAVNVQIVVSISGKNIDVASTPAATRGDVVTSAQIEAAKAEAKAAFAEAAGDKAPYYSLSIDGADLSEIADKALDQDVVVYYNYTPTAYTVQINGQYFDTVTVEDLNIELPAHTVVGYDYDYTIGNVVKNAVDEPVPYTFTVADLGTLFANGFYNIVRVENSTVKDELEDAFGGVTKPDDGEEGETPETDGLVAGLDVVNETYTYVMDPTAGGVMDFAMTMLNSGYSYIAFNNQPFMYMTKDDVLEVSLQTMIDAMMNDAKFGSAMLIKLGHGDLKTPLLNATIDIGRSADDIICDDFTFTLGLSSVPSQLTTVANGLDAVKAYMTFEANPDKDQLDINLDLPEAVYEVYLTALLATSTLDKTDMNAMNHAIAFNFFDDYLEAVLANENITAQTYDNTVNMLIKEFNEIADKNIAPIDVAKYEPYYQMVRDAINGETVELIANEDDYTVTISALAEDVNEALDMIGVAVPAAYKNMIKELKTGNTIDTKMVAYLADAYEDYEAAMIVLDTTGSKKQIVNNVYDYTSDFAATAASLKHEAAIVLLDDIDGDINLAQSAVIDLNGKTINGNLNFTGRKLIIMDSSLNTVSGGGINGTISGDVVILAGTYSANVSKFLRDGYYQENGAVKNALFYYENGDIVIDTDKLFDENYVEGYLPAVHYLATEIALDFALNYFTASSLTIEGNDIYTFNLDDIVGILGTDSNAGKVANLVDDLLAMIRFDAALPGGNGGIDEFINMVAADLLDLENVIASVKNGTKVGDYKVTTGAWDIAVKHVAEGDYITAGVVTNMDRAKSTTLSLRFAGENKDKTLRYLNELDRILVQEETNFVLDLDQPYRSDKTLMVSGGLDAELSLDFSHNCEYNRLLAAVCAYFCEDLTDELVKDGCIMELNDVMSKITVGDFFTAINNAVQNKEINFSAIAEKLNVELSAAHLKKLNDLYDKFQNGVGKALAKLGLPENDRTPLSDLIVNGTLHYNADTTKNHTADAYYRGYGVNVDLKESYVSLKIKFAEKCDGLWGDANRDGNVNFKDSVLILQWAAGRIAAEDKYDLIHLCVCDVNGDGNINFKDAVLILQYRTGRFDKFPVEK